MSGPERQTIPLVDHSQRKRRAIFALQEVMFCLNIASAIGYALLGYIYNNAAQMRTPNDSTYYFLRSAFRINGFFHIKSLRSVNPAALARQFQFRWNQLGYDLLALVTVLAAAALLLFLLRLSSGSPSYPKSLSRAAGLTAIFAAPLCYLYFSQLFHAWSFESLLFPGLAFLQNSASIVAAIEIFCVTIILVLFRKHQIPLLLLIIFNSVHCLFWILAPWPAVPLFLWGLYTPYLFVAILALSGIVWLFFAVDIRTDHPEILVKRRAGKGTVCAAVAAFFVVLLLWFPAKGHRLARPPNMDSLTIELSRGPCFGSCVVYTLTIRGNGQVDLVQQPTRRIPVYAPQEKIITREQVSQILESLDRANFLALEDRAFSWCFDTPSVGVTVSLDGRTKRIVSDIGCTDAKGGVQTKFVDAASEIDRIVGTENMLVCERGPCRI